MRYIQVLFLMILFQITSNAQIFDIGTKWTYEYFVKANNPNPNMLKHEFITYEITDTVRIQDSLWYQIGNSMAMFQDGNKIYFKAKGDVVQLTYDFAASDFYTTKYYDFTTDTIKQENVVIDSIVCCKWDDKSIQYVSIDDNGSFGEPLKRKILNNVGKLTGGLLFDFGNGIVEYSTRIGDLRCFEQGNYYINFINGIPCDTVWTEVINEIENTIDVSKIVISPNPITDIVRIDTDEKIRKLELYGISGQLLKSKYFTNEIKLLDIQSGVYFLKIFYGEYVETRKIIKN